MAKNYTFSEAVAIVATGKDMEAIQDLGRRYPILVQKVGVVATKAGAEFVELMSFMPEYLTANKVNTGIKNAVFGGEKEADESGEDTDEATDDSTESTGDVDYESMSGKQLWDILGKAGKRKLAKSTKKSDLVEACKAMDAGASDDTEEANAEEAETSENPYEGKSAMDLFKECKKRGIKAAPKKPAKFYTDLLIKADASTDDADEAEAESDDWDKEEAPKEEKKAPAKKADKKAAKPAKKAEAEAEGDDDWDI